MIFLNSPVDLRHLHCNDRKNRHNRLTIIPFGRPVIKVPIEIEYCVINHYYMSPGYNSDETNGRCRFRSFVVEELPPENILINIEWLNLKCNTQAEYEMSAVGQETAMCCCCCYCCWYPNWATTNIRNIPLLFFVASHQSQPYYTDSCICNERTNDRNCCCDSLRRPTTTTMKRCLSDVRAPGKLLLPAHHSL